MSLRLRRTCGWVIAAMWVGSVAGAAQAPAPAKPAPAKPGPAVPVAWQPSYHFEIGDTVDFKFPYTPELDFSAPVRPDGAIFFPYLGDISLLGRTVSELSGALRERYTPILRSPEVTIIVRSFQPMRVFVAGEVPAPGRFEYRPGLTVSQAVYGAGGFRDTANRKEIVLLRPVESTSLKVMMVSVAARGAEAGDLPLLPNDIVVVAKSKISKLGQIVQQYSRDLLPVSSLGFFFNLIGSTAVTTTITGGGGQ